MSSQTQLLRASYLASIEDLIDEARNGRMFILVDDEDRENEGDLVIPAQMATPDAINFMARYGRGLICLAMTPQRIEELGLEPMVRQNRTPRGTAFTASIEARDGISTGISAADRARTVAVAIDATNGADRIVSPGHVFPLIAREGGTLVRAGHTEAAVDIARLAGLNPSGVICEIMKDDGTMARMDDLVAFAQFHNLKISTIRDLIAYRRRYDHLVERVAETEIESEWGGRWRVIVYRNKADGQENLALVKGDIDPAAPTMVRMHVANPLSDILREAGPRSRMLSGAMEMIAAEGRGAIVLVNRHVSSAYAKMIGAHGQESALANTPEMDELRDYGIGAQILADLGIHDMILLTASHHTLVALAGYGLSIVEERRIDLGLG
ncbi:MAG: 3,4-dihydroxy-2-butanone-4-phosphate synthase [Sphingomonas sp.]